MRSVRRSILLALAAVALQGAVWSSASAQGTCSAGFGAGGSCNTTVNFTVNVQKVVAMTVAGGATFSLQPTGGIVTAADYSAGAYDVASTLSLLVSSNSTWNTTIMATAATFGAPCAARPVGTLLWGRTATTRTTPLSTTSASILPATNLATAGTTVSLFFRMTNVTWTGTPPATCTVPFTVSAI